MSALDEQVGGGHYKDCKIQPAQYIEANDIRFLEGCVIKRCTRHNKPTGKGRQDIEKAIHELQLLLELRYGDQGTVDATCETANVAAPVGDGIADDTAAVQRGGTLPARAFLPEQLPPFHCTTPGCQEPANRFGLCTVHQPSESEATHRDAGGVRYKQDPAGRWLQWGLDSWFYWSSDPKAVPGYLQALPAYDGHD